MKLKVFIFLKFIMVLMMNPVKIFAAEGDNKIIGTLPEAPLSDIDVAQTRLNDLLVIFINIFWILAIGFVIWAAYIFLAHGDNEDKVTEAKQRLKYAVIAAIIALLATGINVIVYNFLTGTII